VELMFGNVPTGMVWQAAPAPHGASSRSPAVPTAAPRALMIACGFTVEMHCGS
jgi:hypothetical protein